MKNQLSTLAIRNLLVSGVLLAAAAAKADSFDYIKCSSIYSLMEQRGRMMDDERDAHQAKWRSSAGTDTSSKRNAEFVAILESYKADMKLMRKDYSKYSCP